MFDYLRQYSKENVKSLSENVALYGLDADLIMLSIFHCNLCNNIFILREMPTYGGISTKDKISRNSPPITYIDIKALSRGIVLEMTGSQNTDVLFIYDYVFLCFFLGNDFLPHFPSLNIRTNGIDRLLDIYRKILFSKKLHIIGIDSFGNLSIQWKYLGMFISQLASYEESFIQMEYALRNKSESKISRIPPNNPKDREEFINNIPLMYRAEEMYIAPEEYYWQNRYYSSLFQSSYKNQPEIKTICMNYLEGLEWVFLYYSQGCPHWKWKYHYSYPPLLEDLKNSILPDMQPILEFSRYSPLQNVPHSPDAQLAYVLPRVYLGLLSEKWRDFLEDKLDHFYPVSVHLSSSNQSPIRFLWAFCRFFWEAHVLLPEIPLEEWSIICKE